MFPGRLGRIQFSSWVVWCWENGAPDFYPPKSKIDDFVFCDFQVQADFRFWAQGLKTRFSQMYGLWGLWGPRNAQITVPTFFGGHLEACEMP